MRRHGALHAQAVSLNHPIHCMSVTLVLEVTQLVCLCAAAGDLEPFLAAYAGMTQAGLNKRVGGGYKG